MMAVLVAVFGVGLGIRAIDEAEGDYVTAGATGEPLTVDIELGDLFLRPPSVEVPAGTEVIVNVTNIGQVPHDLKLNGTTGTALLAPGGRATASLGVVSHAAQAWCTVPGHKEAGMVFDIRVVGAAAGATAAAAGTQSPAGAKVDFAAAPPAAFKGYDPALAPTPDGREHVLTLRATEKVLEVAPGVTQEMWTFNDQFPGPPLRGRVGDIRVEPGERVRVWVVDGGPSENSSFHIVGTIFDTVFKEGAYLLRPDDRRGGAQALDLQSSQGGFVEFTLDEAGLYPIVTHKSPTSERGRSASSRGATPRRPARATEPLQRTQGRYRGRRRIHRARAAVVPPFSQRWGRSVRKCRASPGRSS